jgi:hypothetical protein
MDEKMVYGKIEASTLHRCETIIHGQIAESIIPNEAWWMMTKTDDKGN